MNHASLFSGIGGFDLAAEWAGWENILHCEWNEFGKKVLNYYWPKAISYDDITKTDFTIHKGTIDVLTGGFPCQPYSAAGKRLGKEDERHLWPEMLRAIKEIQPRWVVGENVRGLTNWNGGLVFDEVQADLEAAGYEVTPFLLPACAVNAPHRRDRIWFVAYSESWGAGGLRNEREKAGARKGNELSGGKLRLSNNKWDTANTNGTPARNEIQTGGNVLTSETVTNTSDKRLQGCEVNGSVKGIRENGNEQPTRCLPPTWQNFPTQSPICSGDDGISSRLAGITFPKFRNESIKAYGNAIVPQVAFQIFKAINEYENKFLNT